jgi:hypothetical protein
MKGKIILTACLLIAAQTIGAQSGAKFGVKGGLELNKMDFNSDALKSSNRTGFYIGPVLNFKLPIIGLGVDASLLYSQRSLKVDGETMKQQSILLPANVRYGINIAELIGIFASAGPQFSFNAGKETLYWQDEEHNNHQYTLQNTLLSVNLGLGVTLGRNIEGAIYYNIPTGKTGDFTWDKLEDELKEQTWRSAKSKSNAWHLSVTYYF